MVLSLAMVESSPSHYETLLDIVSEQKKLHPEGIAVSTIMSTMERSTVPDVFTEGEMFAGILRRDLTEACLTVAASPHVPPDIPQADFLASISQIVDKQVTLPAGMKSELFPPHLIAWWRRVDGYDISKCDVIDIYRLPQVEQEDFFEALAKQSLIGLEILREFGHPVIYGTWGYALPAERAEEGLSRGSPSVDQGHSHIAVFHQDNPTISLQKDLSSYYQLNHYAPWNRLIHQEFGDSTADIVKYSLDKAGLSEMSVQTLNGYEKRPNGTFSYQDGISVAAGDPMTIQEAYRVVATVAGSVEDSYQKLKGLHEMYHKNYGDTFFTEKAENEIRTTLLTMGLNDSDASSIARFILSIRPTYGQLRKWETELNQEGEEPYLQLNRIRKLIHKRDRFMRKFDKIDEKQSLRLALLKDT